MQVQYAHRRTQLRLMGCAAEVMWECCLENCGRVQDSLSAGVLLVACTHASEHSSAPEQLHMGCSAA